MPDPEKLRAMRDVVVIGCSAGGVEALPRIVQQLPADFEAAVMIVQHMAATGTPYLVDILQRRSRLPVAWAEQGAPIRHRQVMVAPPDTHLLCSDGHVALTKGPRENRARPSIDKLFRSAAAACGDRVIGVLLTGMLNDGVAGLGAIRDAGGAVVVQHPIDAAFPELPTRALQAMRPDRMLAIDAMGPALIEMIGQPAGRGVPPRHVALEAEIDRRIEVTPDEMNALWKQTALSCPECHGPMWDLGDASVRRYRCYLGHATTAVELLEAADEEVESALWSAVRALGDRATTLEALAGDAARTGDEQGARSYTERAHEARAQIELARKFMLDLGRRK
jgi:two-component system chemotaxis response regulator CheB